MRFKNEHAGKTTKCKACGGPVIVQGDLVPDRDIFISYSSKDRHIADAVCAALESRKIRCWIAPRDISAGKVWAAAILEGIDDSRALVLIYSGNSNTSAQVLREVDRAVNRTLPILPFRIEDAAMSKEMEYYIGASHWLDAIDGTQEKHIDTLCEAVARLLTEGPASMKARARAVERKKGKLSRFTPVAVTCTLAVTLASLGILLWLVHHFKPQLIQNITTYATNQTSGRSGESRPGPPGESNRSGAPAGLPGPVKPRPATPPAPFPLVGAHGSSMFAPAPAIELPPTTPPAPHAPRAPASPTSRPLLAGTTLPNLKPVLLATTTPAPASRPTTRVAASSMVPERSGQPSPTTRAALAADSPEKTFESIYGAEARRIVASGDNRTAAAFARRLLDDAKKVSEDKPFLIVLLEKAYDFGVLHPEGYAAAVGAMDQMVSIDPARVVEANEKLVVVLGKQFRSASGDRRKDLAVSCLAKYLALADVEVGAGRLVKALDYYHSAMPIALAVGVNDADFVKAKLAGVTKLNELQTATAKPPNDSGVAELAELLLIEFDRRADAAKLKIADPQLARMVLLASKDAGDLAEAESMELGDWYRSRADKATILGKAIALTRSQKCYEVFLKLHSREDAQRLKASRSLQQIADALASLPPQPGAGGAARASASARNFETKAIRVLLVCGGCCHDYARQKDLISQGLAERANVEVTISYDPDKGMRHLNPVYENAEWSNGFDVVIHDDCTPDVADPAIIERILKPHREGLPAVVLHCAMHSYRPNPHPNTTPWMEFTGLNTNHHGSLLPISVTYTDRASPIIRRLSDWRTPDEELYHQEQLMATARSLASGSQKESDTVVWTNDYHGTRVFGTTLGHSDETVADARYLDLVSRGLLWATGHLSDDGKPAPGYQPKR